MRIPLLIPAGILLLAACGTPNPTSPTASSQSSGASDSSGASASSADSDLVWDPTAPAGMRELQIPSAGSLLQGFIYYPNGNQPHPTLLLLHGFPGNERNLDLAQAVRQHGWNVIYFNYRGSWGNPGSFSFRHCVEDVGHLVDFCKRYADSLDIDTSRIVLFGHSMGGWVCLESLRRIPGVKRGFACSTWDLMPTFTEAARQHQTVKIAKDIGTYLVLNRPNKDLIKDVLQDTVWHDLSHHALELQDKKVYMLDEHHGNGALADSIRKYNRAGFQYEVWKTDHPFTNKRHSLIREVIAFLDK